MFVALVTLTVTTPVQAQDSSQPQGDGWACMTIGGDVTRRYTYEDGIEVFDVVWVDGLYVYADLLRVNDEQELVITGLQTNDIYINKQSGIQVLCLHLGVMSTSTPSSTTTPLPTPTPAMTATPLSTSTAVVTKTSVQDLTSVPTLSSTATTIPSGKSLWPIAAVIVLIVFGLFLLIRWYTKRHHH